MINVLIGIQARSTSTRLPGKALAELYNKPVLSWVVNACCDSAKYINAKNPNTTVSIAILCPVGDEISHKYRNLKIVEGDEHDVLSRYIKAASIYSPDYICRITGDCPFLTGFMITNLIRKTVNNKYDYCSNVDPLVRTELDGRDIEVMSMDAIKWLEKHADTPSDREHVTARIRQDRPRELRRAHYLNRLDLSDIKLSIDTEEELIGARKRVENFMRKRSIAEKDVGIDNVFYV